MATKQELEGLQKLASQYGGADSQQFKDYVNQTAGTGTYDTLMAGLKNQASVQTAPMNNVGKIDTTTGQQVQQPIQPITTPTPTQVPNIPQPIQEAPKLQITAPQVEVKTDINEAINPKWQQGVDKALESGQNVKTKLDEGLKAGTIDQTTYNQANNYLNQKEQVVGDQKTQQLNDENFIFQALQTGQNIKGTTPAYNQALNRYNKMNYYRSLSDSQLGAEIGRNLLPGTTEYNDLIKDPVFKEKLTKLQQINLAKGIKVNQEDVLAEKNYEILNNTNVNIAGTNFTLKQALDDGYITADEMSSLTNSPVIATKAQEVEDLKNQYDEAYSTYKNLATDVKNQFKGTGATRRDIAVAVANAQEKLLPGLEALENRYTNALGTLTQMRTDSAQLFATNLGLYKEQQAKAERMSEIEMQRQFQLEDRAYNKELAQKQLEQKFAYEYGDINSTDPNVQRVAVERAVADMYNKYPIVGMESQATKVQKVKDRIAQGMTGAEAIASVEQEIRTSPAYKDLMAQQKADMTPATTTPKVEKVGTDANGKDIYATYNATTGKYDPISINGEALTPNGNVDFTKLDFSNNVSLINKYPKEASFKNNNPTGITWGINANTKKLLEEAGINYGLGTARPANEGGNYIKFDSVQDGLDAYMVLLTQAGTNDVYNRLKQWVGTAEGDSYANKLMSQAGITKGAKFSDLSQEQLSGLMSAQLQKESPNFYKELSNMPAETTFTDEVKSWGDNIINAVGGAKITSIQDKALRTQVSNYIAQKSKAEPNKEVFTIKNALNLLNELENHPGLRGAIGVGTKGKIPATPSAGFMAKLSQLEAQQFLEGIQQMKGMGALSNAEGQKVSAAASSLINTAQSEQEWKAELQKIKDILQGKINTIEQKTGLKFDDMGSPTTGDMEFSNNGTDLRSKYFDN